MEGCKAVTLFCFRMDGQNRSLKSSGGGEAIEAAFVLKEDSVLLFSISSSAPPHLHTEYARDPLHPWYFYLFLCIRRFLFLFFPRK